MAHRIVGAVALTFALAAPGASAAPGDLDPTFGSGGVVRISSSTSGFATITAVSKQSDGKYLVVGDSTSAPGKVVVGRMNADGSMDATFGSAGWASLSATQPLTATAVAAASGGKVLVGVYKASQTLPAMARLNSDGTRDTSFYNVDGDGLVSSWNLYERKIAALSELPDGSMLWATYGVEYTYQSTFTSLFRVDGYGQPYWPWNGSGRVDIEFSAGFERVQAMLVMANGSIFLGGWSVAGYDSSPSLRDAVVAKVDGAGFLDTTFGAGGNVTVDFAGGADEVAALALDPQSRLLAVGKAGWQYYPYGEAGFGALRMDTNTGVLDATFGSAGKTQMMVGMQYGQNEASIASGVAFLANGDLLLGGTSRVPGCCSYPSRVALARLDGNAQGLVPTFGASGIVYGVDWQSWGNDQDWFGAMSANGTTIQVVGGRYPNGDSTKGALLGAGFDQATGSAGGASTTQPTMPGIATAFSTAIGEDGRLRIVGDNGSAARIYSRTATGGADLTWGYQGAGVYAGRVDFTIGNGTRGRFGALYPLTGYPWVDGGMLVATAQSDNGQWAVTGIDYRGLLVGNAHTLLPLYGDIAAVALQGSTITIAGNTSAGFNQQAMAIARLNVNDRTLQASFNGNGIVVLPSSGMEYATAMLLTPDLSILVAGYAPGPTIKVMRVTDSGELDASFGANGVATIPDLPNSSAHSLALQPDGKILVGGARGTAEGFVARLNADGSVDSSFGVNGWSGTPYNISAPVVTGLGVQGDGKIVGAGDSDSTYPFVMRWLPDGTPDGTYNSRTLGEFGHTWYSSVFPDGRVMMTSYSSGASTGNEVLVLRIEGDALDGVPDPFAFTDLVNAPVGQLVSSAPVVITGINGPASVSVVDGAYSIGCNGFFTNQPGVIYGGQSICAGMYTAGDEGITLHTTITIGGVSDTFSTTTGSLPETIITAAPPALTNAAALFSFHSPDPSATFQCQLHGGNFEPCTSPKEYAGLSDGDWIFTVRAVNATGTDPTPAASGWRQDMTAPQTTLGSGPTGIVSQTNATFAFNGSDNIAETNTLVFECRIDGGDFAACTSPASYTGLAGGDHTFEVRAKDPAGNTDATPASRTWTIDNVAPDTTLTSAPSGPTNASSSTYTFVSDDPAATFECNFSGTLQGNWLSCSSPLVIPHGSVADGSYPLYFRAKDAIGNVDPTPASTTLILDRAAPQTTIGSGPTALTASQSPTFTFSSDESGSTFECRLDGGAFEACTSPKSYSGLAGGAHAFDVRATDAATNVDATPASHAWTIDISAPDTLITSGPPLTSVTNAATFTFNASEGNATFECRLDAAAFSPCTSPVSYTGVADGNHAFEVRAADSVGNVDSTPGVYAWTIDTAIPNTTITANPPSSTSSTSASFSFTATEGATFECRLDGGAWASCTSPQAYSALAQGGHAFEVRATDAAGNVDASPASWNWTIDTIPDTSITASPASVTNSTAASFSFSSTEAGTFQCKLDTGAFAACTSPKAYSGLSQGSHTFQVRATDATGNPDPTPAMFTWTVDTAAPNTTIASGPSGGNNPNTATFTFTSSEGNSTFECKLDTGAFAPCASPKVYTGLAVGNHTFQVRAIDAAGNVDSSPASRNWGVK